MNTTELFCTCNEWKESNNHGFKYTGKVFKYCPWCGNKLYNKENKEKEYKDVCLFIERDKYYYDESFKDYSMSFLLASSDDFTDIIKKKYQSRQFPTITALKIGCSGIYNCTIVINDYSSGYHFYITEFKQINIRDCKCT